MLYNRFMENKYFRFFIFLFFIFLCKPIMTEDLYEVPEIVVYGEGFIPLDTGAFVYVFADTKTMRPIIDIVPISQLKSWQAAQVIDRTDIAIAALFTSDTGRFFQVVGFGSYPNLIVNVALAIDKNWKYLFFGDEHYWYSEKDRLSVSLGSEEVYIVQWRRTRMKAMYEEPGVKMPEGFVAFRHRSGEPAPLSLWLENQNSILNRLLSGEGIAVNLPIERLFLNLYHVENKVFKAELMLQTGSPLYQEDFVMYYSPVETESEFEKPDSVLKTLFFANPPVRRDRNIEFQPVILSEEEIGSLLKVFMKYWK